MGWNTKSCVLASIVRHASSCTRLLLPCDCWTCEKIRSGSILQSILEVAIKFYSAHAPAVVPAVSDMFVGWDPSGPHRSSHGVVLDEGRLHPSHPHAREECCRESPPIINPNG